MKLKQVWGLDQLGNWSAFQQDGQNDYSAVANNNFNDAADLNQTRKHNAVNEIDNDNVHANSPSATIANAGSQSAWALPAYDGSGNMTSMPKPKALGSNYTVKYDAWNRLSTVGDGSTVIQTNRYDGLHRRVSRESNTTGVRHFYWNESWQCVEERTGTSTTADRQYVWHPYYIDALAISYNSSGIAHYYVQDGNFNVTAAMDSSGAVVERYSYTPYGVCIVLNADFTLDTSSGGDGLSDISNEYTYTSRSLDVETGLYQYRHRYYHAQLGRFVNRDPIGYRGSPWNLVRYCSSNPLGNLDSTGLTDIGIFFDGAGQSFNGTIIESLFADYGESSDVSIYQQLPLNIFGDGPAFKTIVAKSHSRICEEFCRIATQDPPPAFNIDMFGWSRGAVAALTVAQKLNAEGCKCKQVGCGFGNLPSNKTTIVKPITVRFLGLLDPVTLGIGGSGYATTVSPNVKNVFWAVADNYSFFTLGQILPPAGLEIVKHYSTTHDQIGFPGVLTVEADMRAAAIAAGARFNAP